MNKINTGAYIQSNNFYNNNLCKIIIRVALSLNGVVAIADGKHQEFGKMQNHFWKWLN
jgi:hypothetical protein